MHDPFGQSNPDLNPDLTGDYDRYAPNMANRWAWKIGGIIALFAVIAIITAIL